MSRLIEVILSKDDKVTMDCDVLVIGAGPAGSSAAKAAAERGVKTIFIDKKKEIGVPVQCAEGIGKYLFPYLPFKIPKEQLIWKINGISFWAEGITIERRGGIWSGYAINREKFDKWLANNAIKAGAELLLGAELIDLEIQGDYNITKAIVKVKGEEKVIKPKVMIAADGVDFSVLRLLGFKINKKRTCGEVVSFEMKDLRLDNPNNYQIYLGNFALGSYGYIFPKSEKIANIGVGTLFPETKIKRCYEEFLKIPQVKNQVENGVVVREKSGWAPIRYITERWDYGNVLLVGDAATQNFKPFIEGILPAVICGDLAGKTAFDFIKGIGSLVNYRKLVDNKLGVFFKASDCLIDVLYELGKSPNEKEHLIRLGLFTNIFSLKEIEKLKNDNYNSIKTALEEWNRSKIKQFFTVLREKADSFYFRVV